MILAFEMTWTGTHHAQVNAAILQTVALALPGQAIRLHAEAGHLAELRADPALAAVEMREIALSPHYRYRTQIVSARRGWRELATLRAALAAVPAGEKVLILLHSATPTALAAARSLKRLDRRVVGVQAVMHGNLNDVTGWRSRNPLRRAIDLPSLLAGPQPAGVHLLLLEEAIRRALAEIAPEAAAAADVLPHPANLAEIPLVAAPAPGPPLRVGLVGQATAAKGIGPFLETARLMKARHPGQVQFFLVGRPYPGMDLGPLRILDHPVAEGQLSRAEFLARLAPLHVVFLPLQPDYYRLSASGALVDAITWLTPMIATGVPIVADAFAEHGDIGDLCADVTAMQAALERMITAPDPARDAAQRAALEAARAARMPAALAARYREIVARRFPGLTGA